MGMHNKLYIPKTITVGFQERQGTFTGKLGYIIYTDHTGKLRKEASWSSWRDKKIDAVTVENTPQNGFTFNKGIKRDGHWGSGRSVIRVWDPRNFEFEISVDNLIGILMHADVSKRDITEPCVFAWSGTELILLPTNSVEYQESVKHTEKQGIVFSTKSLVVGHTYGLKSDSVTRVVYLGYLDQYDTETVVLDEKNTDRWNRSYNKIGVKHFKKKKKHVFMNENTKAIDVRDPKAYIASVISEEMHPEFATLMEEYYKHIRSQPIIGITIVPSTDRYHHNWFRIGDEYVQFNIQQEWERTIMPTLHADRKMIYRVEIIQYAKYDADTGVVKTSRKEGSYYDSGTRLVNNPTSLTDNNPQVKQFLQIIQSAYNTHQPNYNHSYGERQEKEKLINDELSKNPDIGAIRFILSDGKITTDSIHI